MNGTFYVPPLTVLPVFADGQSRRESPKMASRPFQFLREYVHKFGTFCPEVRHGTKDGSFHIRPVCWWNQLCACGFTPRNHSPVFLPFQMCLPSPGGNPIFAATQTVRITHYTLPAKSCTKGKAPLETPDNKTGWTPRTFPVLDIQPLFVVSSPRFVVCV